MSTSRAAWLMTCLLMAGCATIGPQDRSTHTGRIEQASVDLEEARARLELARAERAAEDGRSEQARMLAKGVYDSGHLQGQAGLLLARALGELGRHRQQLEIYEALRTADADAVAEDDYVDALAAALSHYNWLEAERRLDIRLQIARRAPGHPAGASAQLRTELEYMAQGHFQKQEWEQLLAVAESLRTMPDDASSQRARGSGLRIDMSYIAAVQGVGQPQQARRLLEDHLRQAIADGRIGDVLVLADFAADRGDGQLALDGVRAALGSAAEQPTDQRIRLHLRLAKGLLGSSDGGDKHAGADHLVYGFELAVQLSQGRGSHSQLYRSAREARGIAAEYGLVDIERELFMQSLEHGLLQDREVSELIRRLASSGHTDRLRAVLEAYLEGGSYQMALQWLRRAGQWELALELAERGRAEQTRQPRDWLTLAEVAFEAGEADRAHEAISHYLREAKTAYGAVRWSVDLLMRHAQIDRAIDTLESAWRREPERTDIAIALVGMLAEHGRGDRAHSVIEEAIDAAYITPTELGRMAELANGVLEADRVYAFLEKAGRGGHEPSLMRAASIAASMADKSRFDVLVDVGLYERLPAYQLETLYHRLAHSLDLDRRVALLERLVKTSAREGGDLRLQLTHAYLEQARAGEALALWEGAQLDFSPIVSAIGGGEKSLRLVEHFEQSGREPTASAPLLFMVAEHYYWLWRARGHTAEAASYKERAIQLYTRVLSLALENGSTAFGRAAALFSQRSLPGLAERAYVVAIVIGEYAHGSQRRSPWYEYGVYLLGQGRAESARHVLGRYVSMSPSRGQVAASVAGQFASAGFAEHAEHFYGMALAYGGHGNLQDAEHRQIVAQAGNGLAEIYLRSGRIDAFLELTSDFETKRRGTHSFLQPNDRPIDLSGLARGGMWEPYGARLESIVDVDTIVDPLTYGHVLWYQGRFEEAWRHFDEQLGDERQDAYRWSNLARFLEERGGAKYAATAYDRAVRAAHSHHKSAARVARGRFLLRQGHIEAALQDYLAANQAHPNRHVFDEMLSDFSQVGRRQMVLEQARADGGPFQALAEATLDSQLGDMPAEQFARQAASKLVGGTNLFEIARALRRAGRGDAIGALIEGAIEDGDVGAAVRLVAEFSDLLADHEMLDPLLEELSRRRHQADSEAIDNLLLLTHLRRGEYRRAVASIEALSSPALRHLQALLALRVSGRLSSRGNGGLVSAEVAPVDIVRLGDAQQLGAAAAAGGLPTTPDTRSQVLISVVLHSQGSAAAFARLRSAAEALADSEGVSTGGLDTPSALAGGLQVMAAAGYADEVAALVAEFPDSVRSRGVIERLATGLAEPGADRTRASADAGLADEQFGTIRALERRVAALLIAGRADAAARMVEEQYAGLINRRKAPEGAWIPSTLEHRRSVLRMLLRVHAARDDRDGVVEVIERWRADIGVDNIMLAPLVGALSRLGFDEQAARVSQQAAQTYASAAMLEQAVRAAVTNGDSQALPGLLSRHRRVTAEAHGMAGRLDVLLAGAEPATARLLVDHALQRAPMMVEARVAQILVAFRGWEMERGRALIGGYADDYASSSEAIEQLVAELAEHGYDVEIARVLGPRLGDDQLSPKTLEKIGRAHIELGLLSAGLGKLRAAVKQRGDQELAVARMARELVVDGQVEAARSLLKPRLEEGGGLAATYLARGLMRLADADERAQADLSRGLDDRRGDSQVLGDVALVALRAGQMDVAEQHIMELLRVPNASFFEQRHPLLQALDIARSSGQSRWLVSLLDRRMPSLLADPAMVVEVSWVVVLGGLMSEAGLMERADQWYEQAITRARLMDDEAHTVAPLLEARAFNLARHGGEAARAEQLARRAISVAADPQPAYFATLALAQYNSGQHTAAVDTARRAMRRGYPTQEHLVMSGGLADNLEEVLIGGRAGYESTLSLGRSSHRSRSLLHQRVGGHQHRAVPKQQIQIHRHGGF